MPFNQRRGGVTGNVRKGLRGFGFAPRFSLQDSMADRVGKQQAIRVKIGEVIGLLQDVATHV